MNDTIEVIALVAALILGVVGVVESQKNWAAWGVILIAAVLLFSRLV